MNKLDHTLKKQLDQTAPDHLEELLSGLPPEEAPLAGAKRKSFFRAPAFRAVAAPLLAAAVVAVVLNVMGVWYGPYDFLHVYEQPLWLSVLWGVAILLVALLLAALLHRGSKKLHREYVY